MSSAGNLGGGADRRVDPQDRLCLSTAPPDSQLPSEAVTGEEDNSGGDPRLAEGALVPSASPKECQGYTPSVGKTESHSSSTRWVEVDVLRGRS